MARTRLPKPTDTELAILAVLWDAGPSTVRQVHDALAGETGYTTVLKMLQIMTEKKLVERDASQRSHIYRARIPQEQTQAQLVTDLLHKAFGGSAASLAMSALSQKPASPEELAEIRKLLKKLEGGKP